MFGSSPTFALNAGMLCQTRKAATSTSTKRMRLPATTEAVEKTRSPTRTTAFGLVGETVAPGWAGAVVMGLLSEGRPCSVRSGRGRRRGGAGFPASGRAVVGRWAGLASGAGPDGREPGRRSIGWDRRPGAQGALLDGGDGLRGLLREVAREGGRLGLLRGGVLRVLRDDVVEVALHELTLGGVLVLLAGDRVGDEDQRPRPLGGVLAVDVDREVVVLTAGDRLGVRDDLGSALGRDLGGLVADHELGLVEVTGAGVVDVGDGVRGAGHRRRDTRGALRRVTDLVREGLARSLGPDVRRVRRHVLGEVLRGARVVRAVHDRDVRVRQVDAVVQRGDLRVVPLGDLAREDARDGLRVEGQVADAVDLVGDRDRGDVDRDVDGLGVAEVEGAGELLVLERGVGAGEVRRTRDEILAAGARAVRRVVDRHAGGDVLEAGGPRGLGGLLCGGAGAGQRARELRVVGAGARGRSRGLAAAALVRRAGGEHDGAGDRDRCDRTESLDVHRGPFGNVIAGGTAAGPSGRC
ncbi:hypothetical protein Cus16_2895 [Curtobacterium sp. ER1/6]|nr:hypothetical protein Cus16_2895 [Curtobacterium sp. ER1/6]